MTFIHQSLTVALLLALLPLLIHIINLVRHQRVEWAAMEFLLASYKRNRRWVWLKQFLLMLMRMAIIALIVMMCAQWITQDQWLTLFGGKVVHHYVVLDDSYSLSQQAGGTTAFDAATKFITNLANEAAQQDSQHKLTVLRCSRVRGFTGSLTAGKLASYADFNAETIDAELLRRLEQAKQKWSVTELADSPRGGLETLRELIDPAAHENRVVYLLSDFRQKDWETPTQLRDLMHELQKTKCELHCIDCARPEEPNLGLVELASDTGTKAAGVPLFVTLAVKNHGRVAARRVQVKLRSSFYAPLKDQVKPGQWKPTVETLPTLLIEQINPGETISRRVQVFFPQAGQHVVEAELPSDCVAADNVRRLVIDCPEGERVLVIDGSVEQQQAYYLSAAFRPLERSHTGIVAEIKPATFLREAASDTLRNYSSIFLLDVPRLEQRGLENLKRYVREGGGVAIFTGENVDLAYYNSQLYENGEGLWPIPLDAPRELPPLEESDTPDFNVSDHPLFSFFRGERNSFLSGVTILRYHPTKKDTKRDDKLVQTLAELRTKQPLFLEKSFGEGRIIACLTTLAPQWNDWAKNPSFVVMVLKLQSYLAASTHSDDAHFVGEPLRIEWEAAKVLPEIAFVSPGAVADQNVEIKMKAEPLSAGAATIIATLGSAGTHSTERAGIYEAWATTLLGPVAVKRFALNVDPAEGDLRTVDSRELAVKLAPVKMAYHRADEMGYFTSQQSGYNRSTLLMALLLAMMLVEQWLAYSASYHPATGGVR